MYTDKYLKVYKERFKIEKKTNKNYLLMLVMVMVMMVVVVVVVGGGVVMVAVGVWYAVLRRRVVLVVEFDALGARYDRIVLIDEILFVVVVVLNGVHGGVN